MKVVKADLDSFKSFLNLFDKEITDSQKINNTLDNFTSVLSNKFSGEVYDEVSKKIAVYKECNLSREKTSSELKSKISSALDSLSSYMEGYSYLDTEELDELKVKRANCQTNYINILSAINSSTSKNSDLSLLRSQLDSLGVQLQEIDKLIEKLEGLPAADASAFAGIDSISLGTGLTL